MRNHEKLKDRLPGKKAGNAGKRERKKLPGWVFVILAAVAVICLAFVWFNRGDLTLSSTYQIESTSEVCFGQNGQTLVIDNGKKTLLVLDAAGDLITRIDGGSDKTPFFYAAYATQTEDGSIYIAATRYGERGALLDEESVLRLRGGKWEELFMIDYTQWDVKDTPLQYGRITELQAYGDRVYFLFDRGSELELREIDADGNVTEPVVIPADGVKNDASYDPIRQQVVVVWRSGGMLIYDLADGSSRELELPEGFMAYDVAARNGEVYYTELLGQTVRHFSLNEPSEGSEFCALETLPFKLDVSADGQDLLATDQIGFYRLSGNGSFESDSEDYVDAAHIAFFARVVLFWVLLAIGAICLLALLIKLLCIFAAALRNESTVRVVFIVAASLIVSFVLAYTLLNQLIDTNTSASEKQVALFAELLMAEIGEDDLLALDSPSDYGSEEFYALKDALDEHTWGSYESEDYYYYCVYRSIDGNIVMLMDFEDTQPCARPQYIDDPEDNIYAEVMHTGEVIQTTEISAYGSYSFILTPIYGSDGSIIGELDAGQNLDLIRRRQSELTRELIISIVISTIVVTMLLLEFNFLLTHVQRRRSGVKLDTTQLVPLRTMGFLIYLADAMQDAFIAILCSQLYHGGLPIPDGVAIALPMSAQLLMMAVFSLFAGRLVERLGSRLVMSVGMLINLAGFLTCMIMGSYYGLLIGKVLIGAAMGTVYVSCTSVAATGGNSAYIADANASLSAGSTAGLTIGAGLSSVLLNMGGWRLIYLFGAVIAAFGLLLALLSGNVRVGHADEQASGSQQISARKFFTSRRVIGYFILMLVPFMMAMSYREYFFPLFGNEHGIDEVRIGQILLLCGILSLYIGPMISSFLIRKIGAYWSIVVASAAMGADMLLFVLFPSLWAVIVGMVVVSLIMSFAITCQYTYFELTPEVGLFGEGRALGIYSAFESLGQTIGPIAYGALLTFGFRDGIMIFCGAMFILLLVFMMLTIGSSKIYKTKENG